MAKLTRVSQFKAHFKLFFENNVRITSTDKTFDVKYHVCNGCLIVLRRNVDYTTRKTKDWWQLYYPDIYHGAHLDYVNVSIKSLKHAKELAVQQASYSQY